ncbi:hypothetical protein KFL_000240525 [Klebsormidium nitens]|uniref:UPF3 domain-containing protein n=1 Tax=Klebsormidium nitens TaxID=105231 RepID=A0A1Y1HN25_KLENI|nr:hypothetical protein KFL_000240525 [Klebsormidium nitens]|eukprot:GAQ79122.1 hypothetical protein KFL_000240525 [Klebsormidium nitens]
MAQESKTKVVIRKLPPYLKQEGLLEAVNKNFEGAYDWFSYYPGKLSHRRLVHSRAYLNFKKAELVYDFYESFDGHIFVNEKGVQFRAEVEYAPYQKVPKGRNKKDLREGTIFEDPDYLSFLAELENPKPSASASDAKREEAEKAAAKGPIITPLIQFIRDKRASKAAGREKVGPRSTSRDSARKAASAAPLGSASSRSGKGGSNEKGILERKGTGKDDSSRKSSARTSRRDSSSACEADKTDSSSQNAARSTPRDPTGILKRPPTPESEAGPSSDRRKDASARGGPEKRIVKGALASIIGGGLGRPPRGSRDADVRDAGFGDGTSRGGGRQSRRDQRSAPAPSPLPAEPSGWGDLPDGASTAANSSAGPSADWGTENPLAANMAKTGTEPSAGGRKEGASRRGGVAGAGRRGEGARASHKRRAGMTSATGC